MPYGWTAAKARLGHPFKRQAATKGFSPSELAQAIQAVHRGEAQLHPGVTRTPLPQFVAKSAAAAIELTARELDVLRLIVALLVWFRTRTPTTSVYAGCGSNSAAAD